MADGALMGTLRVNRKGNATTIDFTGPFFEADPEKQFDENVDTMLAAMAKEGAEDVRAQVDSHRGDMPRWTGFSEYRVCERADFPWRKGGGYSIIWTSTHNLPGRPEAKSASGGLSEFRGNAAASVLAAMSTIEGRWHPFRVTKNRLGKSRAVNMAELTKGME